jgi:hypothetical protein
VKLIVEMGVCVSTNVCATDVVARRSNPSLLPEPSTPSSSSSQVHRLRGGVPTAAVVFSAQSTPLAAGAHGDDVALAAASATVFAASTYSRAGSSASLHQTAALSNDIPEGVFVYQSLVSSSVGNGVEQRRGSSFGGSRTTTTTTGTTHASLPNEQAADVGLSRASPHDLNPNGVGNNNCGVAALPSFFDRRQNNSLQQNAHPISSPPAASVVLLRRSAEVSASNLNESAECDNHRQFSRSGKFDDGVTNASAPMAVANPLLLPSVANLIGSAMPLATARTFSPASNNEKRCGGFVPISMSIQQPGGQYPYGRSPGSALSTRTATLDAVPESQFLLASVATLDGGIVGGLVSLLPSTELAVRSRSQDDYGEDAAADDTATMNTITHPDPPLHRAASEMLGNHSATTSSMWGASQFRSIDIGSTMALVQRSFSHEA